MHAKKNAKLTNDKRRWQIFHDFRPLSPYRRQFFSTIHRQIWQIFDPSPPKTCRRLKWMVPNIGIIGQVTHIFAWEPKK